MLTIHFRGISQKELSTRVNPSDNLFTQVIQSRVADPIKAFHGVHCQVRNRIRLGVGDLREKVVDKRGLEGLRDVDVRLEERALVTQSVVDGDGSVTIQAVIPRPTENFFLKSDFQIKLELRTYK